ncbi:hypothetical protein CN918_31055 [Priestia megaterium]|nr:hypothetical protein CN918_31055 [Priestia megaterium]
MEQTQEHNLLDTAYFTKDAYFTLYPHADETDYEEHLAENYVILKVAEANENLTSGKPYDGVRRIVLGSDYVEWLEVHQKRNSNRNLKEYMRTITDEEAERRWSNHEFRNMIDIFYIPVFLHLPKKRALNHVVLSKEITNEVETHVMKAIKAENVVAFPQILGTEALDKDFEEGLMEKASAMLNDNKSISFRTIRKGNRTDKITMDLKFIPFACKMVEKSVRTVEEELKLKHLEFTDEDSDRLSTFLTSKLKGFSDIVIDNTLTSNPRVIEREIYKVIDEKAKEPNTNIRFA